MESLTAVILGLVEGLTEFMPVSSTGHLIVVGHLLGFEGPKASVFEVFIQLGAILAVLFLYRERFFGLLSFEKKVGFSGQRGIFLLFLTTLPAVLAGAGFHGFIKRYLFSPMTVALGLGVGGLGILLVERRRRTQFPSTAGTVGLRPGAPHRQLVSFKFGLDSVDARVALRVGLFQCLALWPGISRAAATILGGMASGLDRKTAAEYSFLAAVPVMFAAVLFDLYKSLEWLHRSDIPIFLIGFTVAFLSAWVTVRFFIRLLQNHTLEFFGWYRLVAAFFILWIY